MLSRIDVFTSHAYRDHSSPSGTSDGRTTFFQATILRRLPVVNRVRIRITRPPPAPRMDGFDVGGFQFNHIYNVPEELGRYLIVAGYGEHAARFAERVHDRPTRRRPKRK